MTINTEPLRRGEIYYISNSLNPATAGVNRERQGGRFGIIVSSNELSPLTVVSVVYLTTTALDQSTTHIPIRSTGKMCIAVCENIYSVDVGRFAQYAKATCTEEELSAVDEAIKYALALSEPKNTASDGETAELRSKLTTTEKRAEKAEKEAEKYKKLFNCIADKL